MSAHRDIGDGRIGPRDRSGVLHPENLARYGARWLEPDPAVADVVDRFWHVEWNLEPGEVIHQRIIDLPTVTLTVEEGAVPAPLVVTGVHRAAWLRPITGSGSAFGIRLRPAGLAIVSDLAPEDLADSTIAVTRDLDAGLHRLLGTIAEAAGPDARARAANRVIAERLAGRPLGPGGALANSAFDELDRQVRSRIGDDLAERLGVAERSVQRALKETLGHGPKWISRRIRLQEVARRLATEPELDLARLAVDLGYSDQAHLTNDFRRVAGVSPGAYRRSLSDLGG